MINSSGPSCLKYLEWCASVHRRSNARAVACTVPRKHLCHCQHWTSERRSPSEAAGNPAARALTSELQMSYENGYPAWCQSRHQLGNWDLQKEVLKQWISVAACVQGRVKNLLLTASLVAGSPSIPHKREECVILNLIIIVQWCTHMCVLELLVVPLTGVNASYGSELWIQMAFVYVLGNSK